jgi:CTP:molybdopterin cytidylyltransferase MocA
MGFPKALAVLRGRSFVEHVAAAVRAGGCTEVVVVAAAPHAVAIRALGLDVVDNPAPELGMLGSLQVGLGHLLACAGDVDHVVVALVDHPRVRPETVRVLIAGRADRRAAITRPRYGDRHGHPYVLGSELFVSVMAADPRSSSARDVYQNVSSHSVDVDDPAVVEDIDTPEDLARIGAHAPDPP